MFFISAKKFLLLLVCPCKSRTAWDDVYSFELVKIFVPLMFLRVVCALASESSSEFRLVFKYRSNSHFFFSITQQLHESWSARHASERAIRIVYNYFLSVHPAILKCHQGTYSKSYGWRHLEQQLLRVHPMRMFVAVATALVATHKTAQQHLDVIQLVRKSNNTVTLRKLKWQLYTNYTVNDHIWVFG